MRRALISVYDKTGVEELAAALHKAGVEIVSTGSTAATIAAAGSWTASGNRAIQLYNINQFLTQYEGADGVKTGFTEQAGRTLVASATRDGHRVYVVLLNDNDRYGDAAALLDWAFTNHQW